LTPGARSSISPRVKGHARNLMTDRVISVQPDMTLADIVRVLVAGQHGGLPVVDDDERVIGFLSESDVLDAVLRDASDKTRVRDLMSHPVLVVDEFSTTDEVMSLLRDGRVRHLPVVRTERLVGIITPHDVLRYFAQHVLPIPSEDA
jgi:CBS domain-containing protein